MTARALGVLAAMLALLGAGLSTGTEIYYYLFMTLALAILFALASAVWTMATIQVSMKGVKPRVARGEKLMTIITVAHRCLLPVGSLYLTLNVPGGSGRQEINISVPPFQKRVFRNVLRCPHRGSYEAGIVSMRVGDLFGLFRLSRKSQKKLLRVEVYPKACEVGPIELKASDLGPECMARATEDNASPSDIRKWQNGDELKKVHWKLSLRKRELMVRTFEESARPDTLIIPDLSEISALQDQRLTLEDCVCEASLSAAKAQLEAGFPVRMPLQARRPQELNAKFVGELGSFTEALMRVNFDSPYPYEQVLMLMMQRIERTGGAVLVSTRLTTRTADIALRMQKSGIQVKLIWVTDAPRSETLEMLERLKMTGALVERINPWAEDGYAAVKPDTQSGLDAERLFDD